MATLWISAAKAPALVAGAVKDVYPTRRAICTRAHHGLLAARCASFTVGSQRRDNEEVPAEFWWAEGEVALEQDWSVGDFSTWIDQKVECHAFGVMFALQGLLAMMPLERQGVARRATSVSGSADWVSAKDALRFIQDRTVMPAKEAAQTLVLQARLGFVPARAVLMSTSRGAAGAGSIADREWDVPDDFWKAPGPDADWVSGGFRAYNLHGSDTVTAEGIHFALPSLEAAFPLGPRSSPSGSAGTSAEDNKGQKGRPPAAFWDDLWCAIWGDVFRGDLKPKTQADVQNAMLDWLASNGQNAVESTVKPRARRLFLEMMREGKKAGPD